MNRRVLRVNRSTTSERTSTTSSLTSTKNHQMGFASVKSGTASSAKRVTP